MSRCQDQQCRQDYQEHPIRNHLERQELPDLCRIRMDRVLNHRGVDGYPVLRNEIGGRRTRDHEKDRQRLDGQPMREKREHHDEQAQSGQQVRAERGVIQLITLPEPLRQLVDVDGVAHDEQRERVGNAEADVRNLQPELR